MRRRIRQLCADFALAAAALMLKVMAAIVQDAPEFGLVECGLCTKPLDPAIAVDRGPWYCAPCDRAIMRARHDYGHTRRKA